MIRTIFFDFRNVSVFFVDDLPVNIEAANLAGFNGIVYLPDDTLAMRLRNLGVELQEMS